MPKIYGGLVTFKKDGTVKKVRMFNQNTGNGAYGCFIKKSPSSRGTFNRKTKGLGVIGGTSRLKGGDVLVNTFGKDKKQIVKQAEKQLRVRKVVEKAAGEFKKAGRIHELKRNLGISNKQKGPVKSLQNLSLDNLPGTFFEAVEKFKELLKRKKANIKV